MGKSDINARVPEWAREQGVRATYMGQKNHHKWRLSYKKRKRYLFVSVSASDHRAEQNAQCRVKQLARELKA